MIFAIAALTAAAQAPKVTLTYFQEHFIVRDGAFNESAPLRLTPTAPKLSTVFRKNNTYAVWDERGLTIRVGDSVRSTTLPSVVLSPKGFTRDEILFTQREIKAKRRSVDVSALSGAIRVANKVYFLARWDDSKGKSWAEAMVEVDLSERSPAPKFLARVHALSLADEPVDDQMLVVDGKLAYVARLGDTWGLQTFDPTNGRFAFDALGGQLDTYLPISQDGRNARIGLFVERTPYGTTVAGRIDLKTRFRRILAENRAKMKFVDAVDPACLVLSFPKGASLLNTGSGSLFELSEAVAIRRTSRGLVVWTPVGDPKKAWLFDPARWQVLAWWNSSISPQGDGGQ